MLGSAFLLTGHTAPLGIVGFPLVLQGIPYRIACAPLGGQQQDRSPSEATLGVLLHFPMVFDDFWSTMLGFTFFSTQRAAPLGDTGFLLVFTRFSLHIRLCPTGGAVEGPFPERGHFRCFASFPMVFDDFW